jgi:hypothetical protein
MNFTLQKFCEFLFGFNFQALRDLLFRSNKHRVLFCLDRFDTEIQKYRKDAIYDHRKGDPRAPTYLRREAPCVREVAA